MQFPLRGVPLRTATTLLAAAWAVSASAQTSSFGNACAGASGQDPSIELSGFPYVGLPISVIVEGPAAAPGLLLASSSTLVPLDLTFLGLPGCFQVVSPEFLLGTFTTNGDGIAQLNFIAPSGSAGATVHLQALVIDTGAGPFGQTIGGVSAGLSVTFQPLPPGNAPVVSNFGPTTAQPGELITLQGANFGTDLGALSVFIDGPEPTYLLPVSLVNNLLTVRLAPYVSATANAGPLTLAMGMGGQVQLPAIGGAQFLTPAVGHCWNDTDPTKSAQTLASFAPRTDPQPLSTACAVVVADTPGVGWKSLATWTLANGDLSILVPKNLCPSDQIYLQVKFARCPGKDTDYGGGAIVSLPPLAGLIGPCSASSQAFVGALLFAQVQSTFVTANVPVDVFYDGISKITLRAKPSFGTICGTPKGGVMVKYAPSTLTTQFGGVADNFLLPSEPTTSSPVLSAYLASIGVTTTKAFDDPSIDRHLAHSFTALPINVRAAALEVRLRAGTSGSGNDSINLWTESPPGTLVLSWSSLISALPGAGGSWGFGQTTTFCLDLSALPTTTGPVNLIPALCSGRLHFVVQDDTTVDYVELGLRACN